MIDVIVPIYDTECNLKKLLLSILLQTINDKINVFLVFNSYDLLEKYERVAEIYFGKISITMIANENDDVSLKQCGFDNSTSEFVMFLNENDFFYDAFSVENAYKKIVDSGTDIVCGKMVCVVNNSVFEEVNNIYMSCVSKIFNRDFVKNNNIKFSEDLFIDCYFVGQAILLAENICIEDFTIAVYGTDFKKSFLEEVELFVLDTISIEKSIKSKIDTNLMKTFISDILKILYNNYSLNLGYVDSFQFLKIIEPLELLYKDYI